MSNSHLFLTPAFIRTPLQNGVGRYVCQLQRVVLKFCKYSGGSRGLREFIETEMLNYAKENPGVVVYLKPRRHRSPVISAEYLNGDKQWIPCNTLTKEEIIKWMDLIKTQAGNTTGLRYRKLQHTDFPSIQGPWTPYTFRDPKLNLTEFPNQELTGPTVIPKSATEELVEIFKKQKLDNLEEKRAE